MTNYPYGIDNNITLPGVSGSSPEDISINALVEAVTAIEFELGITPSLVYPDVRTRLDILESRFNTSVPSNITNDGYVVSPLFIWNTSSNVILTISDGLGIPTESRLNGSLYIRGDGYANSDFYIRRNNTWYAIQSVANKRTVVTFPSDANYTATQSNYESNIIEVFGTISATRSFILPLVDGMQWIVFNSTAGGQSVTFVISGQTGVTVANGKRAIVYCNGVDIVRVTPDT